MAAGQQADCNHNCLDCTTVKAGDSEVDRDWGNRIRSVLNIRIAGRAVVPKEHQHV